MEAEKSYEQIRKEEDIRIARMIVNALKNIFARQTKIDDPCLRSCLLVNQLSLTLDVATAALKCVIDDMPDDLSFEIESVTKTVNEELINLMEWCRSPTYSPDHPFGNKLVNSSQFYKNAEINDEN